MSTKPAAGHDVDRVEVLRGPQGTLYGRNATAGAINILTKGPTSQLDGFVTGRVGNYGLVGTEGAIGGALSQSVSARLAFQAEDRNGFGKNIQTGEDVSDKRSRNVRAKIKFAPNDDFSFLLTGDYGKEDDHNAGYRYVGAGRPDIAPIAFALGGTYPTDPQNAAGFGPRFYLETYSVSGEGKLALGESTDLVSITGYRHLTAKTESNTDLSTLNLTLQFITDRSDSVSQELRLSHKFGDFADILLGGYYFHENSLAENRVPLSNALFGLPSLALTQGFWTRGRIKTNAFAAFGQARVHFTRNLTLTLGGRYSHERKSINEGAEFDLVNAYDPDRPFQPAGMQQASTTESRFDPKVTIDYKPSDNVLLYATYSRGFKSGGFNIGGLQPAFNPEILEDYEAGVKLDLFDRTVRLNLAAFHYDYKNLQVNIVRALDVITLNAASAKIDGAEAELTIMPFEGLRFSVNTSYLNARYASFVNTDPVFPERGPQDLKGKKLNYAPKWSLYGETSYTFEASIGKITPRFSVNWVDRQYFSPFNSRVASQGAYALIDAYLGYESLDGRWSANAFVKNLANQTYVVSAVASSGLVGYPLAGQVGAPRTFGLSVTRRY